MVKRTCLSLLIAAQISAAPVIALNTHEAPKQEAPSTVKMNSFIDALMSKMTLEEKLGQMNLLSVGFDAKGPVLTKDFDEKIKNGLVGGVFTTGGPGNTYSPSAVRKLQQLAVNGSRLKIPLFYGYDVVHGHKTIFPINLGLASSWDMDLIERTARAAAIEASADGINWVYSPMVDISRDPRWGRCSEGAGEDIYLGSEIARATVRGYQGKNHEGTDTVIGCVKHYASYGASEAGRDYNPVDMSPVRMYNEYLPPYKAAVDAGVGSVMTAYMEINSIPVTANKWLIEDVLRKQWGFNGLVATDYFAVKEMIAHGMGDESKVSELALNAGIDMDMVSELVVKYGVDHVKSGRVKELQVDRGCRHVLEAKYQLGLFDDPYRYLDEARSRERIMTPDKLALSKEAAIKSMVLLKNSNKILPLKPASRVAFVGPFVKDRRDLIGSWSAAGDWQKASSIWDALSTKYGADKFLYAKGCNIVDNQEMMEALNRDGGMLTQDAKSSQAMIEEAVATAKQADVVVAALGESFMMSGEAASLSNIGLLDNQVALLKALKQTGKPIVLVLMNGRPMTLPWEDRNMDAILETWFSGTKAGDAIVDVLFGDATPSGKLAMTFPVNVGQIPIYYNAKNTGRPFVPHEKFHSQYLDVPNSPLYAFGYGLTYTTFEYGDPVLSSNSIKPGETLTVSATIKNVGDLPAEETAQLYLRDLVGTITRPVKELKGFQKVLIGPGETKTVTFKISLEDLKFYNSDLKYVAEPGEFEVFIGSDSTVQRKTKFVLKLIQI